MSSLPTASTLSSLFIYHCPCLFSALVSLAGGSLPKCLPKAGLYYVCMSASKESS